MSSSSRGAAAIRVNSPHPASDRNPHREPRSGTRGPGFWINAWLPVALAIAMIAIESTTYLGADYTSGPLRWAYEGLFGHVTNARWETIHHLIRKSGHFVGYGLVGLAWLRAWWKTLPGARYFEDVALALIGTGLIAILDEWHQSFLPNRTASPWDVMIDVSGAITLCLVTYVYVRLFRPERLEGA